MKKYHNYSEARQEFAEDRATHETRGIIFPGATGYMVEAFKRDYRLALDALGMDAAQPGLTTQPNSAVPTMLTTLIDPEIYEILFAPNKAAEIFGEVRKGSWTDQTAMFPTSEHTAEVSSYGDFNENGRAGANVNFPQRQSYLYQVISEYGDLELDRMGLARLNWVSELDQAAALGLNKFLNLSYFFGIRGLENYGLINDPNLSAPITPAPKAYGGTAWFVNGVVRATATEIYTDIQSLVTLLITQAGGTIETTDKMTLALANNVETALNTTNNFNVNVMDQLEKNYPGMTVKTAVQYGVQTAQNPQGVVAGNLVQLIIEKVENQKTGYCSFNEKMRAHPIIRALSSFKQKKTSGTWGTVIRQPFGIAQMLGV